MNDYSNNPYFQSYPGDANTAAFVTIGDGVNLGLPAASGGTCYTGPGSKYSLFVKRGILTESVKVGVACSSWADYVFDKNYQLMPLTNVESYIAENKHLPEVPSAEEAAKNGIDVASMDATLLKKVEELTLYMIQMQKENEALKNRISKLEKE
jgi:hypothetical protein